MMLKNNTASATWHKGEMTVQKRVGSFDKMQKIGPKVIRDFMPDEHRMFFQALSWIVIGGVDEAGLLWASLLIGEEGFIRSPAPTALTINATLPPFDPLVNGIKHGEDVGLLGIMLSNRRRNRVNATVESNAEGRLALSVKQSFGNCPKYIHAREFFPKDNPPVSVIDNFNVFDESLMGFIKNADTFFIASIYAGDSAERSTGVDVSHRGGLPGFILVDNDNTLLIPDYAGNNFFNTLGNLLLDSRAGILFIGFNTGDLIYLTGTIEVLWPDTETMAPNTGKRMLRFTLKAGRKITRL